MECDPVNWSIEVLKDWHLIQFSQTLVVVAANEKHCENPEAEPYVGRDGTGKAFSLKLPSSHLNGNILFCEAGNASLVRVKSVDFFCCRLARQPTHGPNQETGGEAPGGSTRVQLYIVACKYGQHKMSIWQFSHIVQTVLVMAKRIIADCMTSSWLWVNLCCYPCKHESEILSRCFKCPPCLCRSPSKSKRYQSVAAFLTSFSGMAFRRLATSLAPAVTNWRSRAFGETTIPVIFARAIVM